MARGTHYYVLDPGINKPFDRIAKEFAEEAPLLLLRLLGMIKPGDTVELEPLRPETAPPVAVADYVAMLRLPDEDAFTFHLEFYVRYRSDLPSTVARYGGSLASQYQRPVTSVLFCCSPRACRRRFRRRESMRSDVRG